jgi:hypothetical protein
MIHACGYQSEYEHATRIHHEAIRIRTRMGELVAYPAVGMLGEVQQQWHKIGFTRPTAEFVRDMR